MYTKQHYETKYKERIIQNNKKYMNINKNA